MQLEGSEWEKAHVCTRSPVLKLFIWRPQGMIPIKYSLAFLVDLFGVLVSTDWLTLGQGVISYCNWLC